VRLRLAPVEKTVVWQFILGGTAQNGVPGARILPVATAEE